MTPERLPSVSLDLRFEGDGLHWFSPQSITSEEMCREHNTTHAHHCDDGDSFHTHVSQEGVYESRDHRLFRCRKGQAETQQEIGHTCGCERWNVLRASHEG